MTRVNVTVQGAQAINRRLLRLGNEVMDQTEAMEEAADVLRMEARAAFGSEGPGWAPLAPATIADRQAKGFGSGPKLRRTGVLRSSWTQKKQRGSISRARRDGLEFGSAHPVCLLPPVRHHAHARAPGGHQPGSARGDREDRPAQAGGGEMSTVEDVSVFGPMVSGDDLEEAVRALLRKWFNTYLAHIERRAGLVVGTCARPRSWGITGELGKAPEDQLPGIKIISNGTHGEPIIAGDGHSSAVWELDLLAVCSARGMPGGYSQAMIWARRWALVMRAIIAQQAPTDDALGTVAALDWMGENYDDIDATDERTICAGTVSIQAYVPGAVQRWAGPAEPLMPPEEDPGPEDPTWPIATDVIVDVEKAPIEED